MAAHIQASHETKFSSVYFVAADGKQAERYKQKQDYIDQIELDCLIQKRSQSGVADALEWKPEFFPKQMIFQRGEQAYGFNGYNDSGNMVSQTFKDCHDRIHTVGGNQFFPVEILNQDHSPYPGQFYFFVPTTVREAINDVLGGGYFTQVTKDHRSFTIESMGRKRLAVFKDRIEGCAAWIDPAYSARTKRTFFSDTFLAELQKQGVEGFHCATMWQEL